MTEPAWQVLRGLVAWQVRDIPRLPLARDRDGGPGEGDRLAAAAAGARAGSGGRASAQLKTWRILDAARPDVLPHRIGAGDGCDGSR